MYVHLRPHLKCYVAVRNTCNRYFICALLLHFTCNLIIHQSGKETNVFLSAVLFSFPKKQTNNNNVQMAKILFR